ncbi:MAG: hypothetical protein CMN85_09220 [Spongiibacteraceae bacterium]|nr:hypothetical protein [Spongiibacteraceae bacterium]|tara:strand:- start:795 stop:1019 length:225 start_codon:yes stop_codon:yes gene_type:complete
MDFTIGRYLVIAPNGSQVGMIDGDEYIRDGLNLIYRIDGDEVYTAGSNAQLSGYLTDRTAHDLSGNILFTIEDE